MSARPDEILYNFFDCASGELMFDTHFETFLADTAEARKIHYQLRYRVYCLETGYEDASAFPDRLEKDEFDSHSVHFIVRHRMSGQWMAAMRMVLGDKAELPIAEHCELDRFALRSVRGSVAEVSRLCVVNEFRRRRQERHTPYEIPWRPRERPFPSPAVDINERRREPEIMLGLARAARAYSLAHGIDNLWFLAAGSLVRVVRGLGLPLVPVGPECHFRGKRRPYTFETAKLMPTAGTRAYDMFMRAPAFRCFSEWEEKKRAPAANGH